MQSARQRVGALVQLAVGQAPIGSDQRHVVAARGGLVFDDAVNAAVAKLKEKGLTSPYLKSFVVARVNPLRFIKGEPPSFDDLQPAEEASAPADTTGGGGDAELSEAAKRVPAHLLERSRAARAKWLAQHGS